jgi:hypothetical protein
MLDTTVLCHVATTKEFIVVAEREYDFWAATYQNEYEFIAKGTPELMKMMQKLIRESEC